MMYKKLYIVVFIAIIFFTNIPLAYAKTNNKSLIIYENEKTFASNENKVNHLKELLYVFNQKVEKISLDKYEKSYMDKYDSIFVINLKNDLSNQAFLDDLSNYKSKIYWIGDKFEEFLRYSKKYSISYNHQNNNITSLFYKNKKIVLESGEMFNIFKTSDKSKIISTMSDGYNDYPYIISEKNLYYISRWDLEKSFIFEDSLNDFYKVKDLKNNGIFLKIDNVNQNINIKKMKDITDYLYSQGIPFLVGMIPKNLDNNKEFLKTVQEMQDKGGTIVLKGYSNYRKNENTNEYEFWDIENDMPISKDIKTYTKDRIINGLRICIENKIYPLAFEAPGDAMNMDGYNEVKKYFSTYVGKYQNNNDNFSISCFPYKINDSDAFNTLIPENLGDINNDDVLSVDKVKEDLEKLLMVRDYSGGFSISPDTDIDYVKQIISHMRDKNIEFIDLKSQDNYVKVDDISIVSKNNEINSSYDKSKSTSKIKENTKFESVIKNINNIVIGFVSFILILFLIIFIVFRKINTNKFTRR